MVRNQTVVAIEENGYYDLQTKVKAKKKKCLVNGEGSDQIDSMKKNASKLKSKGCTNLPIVIESSSYSELLNETDEMPKKLKRKGTQRFSCDQDGDCEISSKELPIEQQEATIFISKKRKRDITDSGGIGDGFPAKKKKKHKPAHCVIQLSGEDEDEPVRHISKKQKNISQETMFHDGKKIQTGDRDIVKEKKVCCLKEKGIANTEHQLEEEFGYMRRSLAFQQILEGTTNVSEEESKVMKKKRKKKKRKQPLLTLEDNQDNQSGVSIESQPKQKSKRKPSDGKEKTGLISNSEQDSKVKKKKMKKRKTQTKVESDHSALLEDDGDVATNESWSATKRTKNAPKSKKAQDHVVSWEDGRSENDSRQHIKKKKKKKKDRENRGSKACGEEPSFKKAKIKQEPKLRRQALQEEIDRESGKMKTVKEEGESDAHFGQWTTATFENSEQKTKFLRLMGGFKKGSVPVQGPPAHASKLNMALDKSKEQNLQQKLQTEFEKALAWKHHRGIGLGFQPPIQKQVHIDKFASRSIKFED
nr:lysine-rich nucleolar protein 1 isoform X1 [Zootoca vivipara]XP_034987092.1 lysine-rich nucleolar protein 1 isoform X1 [Zootoca vivipara]